MGRYARLGARRIYRDGVAFLAVDVWPPSGGIAVIYSSCASVNYSANQLGLSQSCFIVSGSAIAPGSVTVTNIKQYAQQNSWGINQGIANVNSFVVSGGSPNTNTCGTTPGYLVTASYHYNIMNYLFNVTLTAKSCFPINIS
jgi:hypothetical protein